MSEGDRGQQTVILAPRWFSRMLFGVFALTFICLALWVVLAITIAHPTPQESTLTEGVSHAFTACLGAILGLVGGKLS
jgi:hypothetical protein